MLRAGRDKADVNMRISERLANRNPRDFGRKLLMGGSRRVREITCGIRTNEGSICEGLR